jgi:hypothetical protein
VGPYARLVELDLDGGMSYQSSPPSVVLSAQRHAGMAFASEMVVLLVFAE